MNDTTPPTDAQQVFSVAPWAVDFFNQCLDFLSGSKRNVWIYGDGFKVYLRKSRRLQGHCLDIASVDVEAETQGKKRFTGILMTVEGLAIGSGFDGVFVENVLSERFADFFRKNDWREIGAETGVSSFFKVTK